MSQTTLDSNTPEGSAADQQAAKQPPRRRRRPASRSGSTTAPRADAAAADAAAAAAPAQPAAETVVPVQPAAEPQPIAPATAQAAPQTAVETPHQQSSGARPRSRRGGRKNGVQLVMPPAPATPAEPETPAAVNGAQETTEATALTGATAEPRTVPVVTEPGAPTPSAQEEAQPSEPLGVEPTAGPAVTTPEQAVPVPSRYRFGRRTAADAPPPAPARPERLSGSLTNVPTTSVEAAVPSQAGKPETPESVEEAPSGRNVLDDIVSALGLREASSAPAPAPTELPPETAEGAEALPAEETMPEAEGAPEAAGEETETQGGVRRRRRRRRGGTSHPGAAEDETAEQLGAPEAPFVMSPYDETEAEPGETNGSAPSGGYTYSYPEQAPYSPYTRPSRDRGQTQRQPWDVVSGTQQLGQPESPFGAPEPSFARGFGPQPRGVAGPARETFPRTGRPERADIPPMSPNVLAATVTQAIQQQTDRLLTELRHQANPPAMTVMFPPFPSTERIGVFVDVANLLYSARSLRISIDFGRLLDFLRGSRRLVRAHAYAPTNPDPHADQAFLSAVKGLGYRITTKNYKTFSSGAKKADMDLDLCMDIVRLVDAKALDTVMLVSGDSDFLPLLEYCSDHGVRVEVAAFDDSAAMILRQSCDLFINLSMVDDIRA